MSSSVSLFVSGPTESKIVNYWAFMFAGIIVNVICCPHGSGTDFYRGVKVRASFIFRRFTAGAWDERESPRAIIFLSDNYPLSPSERIERGL